MSAIGTALQVFKSATYWNARSGLGKGFGIAYPADAQKVSDYIAQLDAGNFAATPPTGLTTKHAQGIVGMLAGVAANVTPVTPPPPPPTGSRFPIRGVWDNPEGPNVVYSADWTAVQALGFNAMFIGMDSGVLGLLASTDGYGLVNAGLYASDAQVTQYLPSCWTVLRSDKTPAMKWAYVADESNDVAALTKRSQLVKTLCPAVKQSGTSPGYPACLTMASHFDPATLKQIAPAVDWLAIDYYPCQYSAAENLAQLQACIDACEQTGKPFVVVYQAFTDATAKGQISHYRLPTVAEFNAEMAVIAASKAAHVFGYCYGEAVNGQPAQFWLQNQNGQNGTQDLVSAVKAANAL